MYWFGNSQLDTSLASWSGPALWIWYVSTTVHIILFTGRTCTIVDYRLVRLAYQPPASGTFLFEQISTNNQPNEQALHFLIW
jgi:hypothetical protein